jgi:hypothetical protein
MSLRRDGDSNPRYPLGAYTLSRRASSTTRASLLIMYAAFKTGRKIRKYFYKTTCYEISPASDLFSDSFTDSHDENLPKRCINFVTEASDVISLPLTTPEASI